MTSTLESPTLTALSGSYALDPSHSRVGFVTRHAMIAKVRGAFNDVTGTATIDGANPSASALEVTIDAASIDTREEKRDAHLRSADFFDVEKFPALTFKSRRVQAISGDTFQLVGDLTIKDTSKEVVLDVEFEGTQKDPWGNQKSGFTATTKISRTAFGLTWNAALETGGVLVGDEIKISLDVQLLKTA